MIQDIMIILANNPMETGKGSFLKTPCQSWPILFDCSAKYAYRVNFCLFHICITLKSALKIQPL